MWVYLQITWVYTATLYENVSQVFETALTACVYTVTFFHKKKKRLKIPHGMQDSSKTRHELPHGVLD